MKQVYISKYGSPEVLKVRDIELPPLKSTEIQIDTKYAGINFSEIMARMKLYPGAPKPPCGIGAEASGIITALGENVKGFEIGQQVMAFSRFGSYASQINSDMSMVMNLPEQFSLKQGAAFPIVYITAYQMIFDLGNLRENETILIHGAGGGVGTAAIQLAKSVNAKIIGTASAWKHEQLRSMGVDHCIDYRTDDVKQSVVDITDGNGVDLIIDPVGAKNWKISYQCLGLMGKLIIYGDQDLVTGFKLNPISALKELWSMPKYKPMSLMSKNRSVMGYHLGRMQGAENKIKRSVKGLYSLASDKKISPVIDKIFDFTEAGDAHRYLQERKNFGKVLLNFS